MHSRTSHTRFFVRKVSFISKFANPTEFTKQTLAHLVKDTHFMAGIGDCPSRQQRRTKIAVPRTQIVIRFTFFNFHAFCKYHISDLHHLFLFFFLLMGFRRRKANFFFWFRIMLSLIKGYGRRCTPRDMSRCRNETKIMDLKCKSNNVSGHPAYILYPLIHDRMLGYEKT